MIRFFLISFAMFTLLLASNPARATVEVTIDQTLFSNLRRLGDPGPLPFKEALPCGQTTVFEATDTHCNIQCTKSYCKSICDSARSGVADLPSTFNVYSDECSEGLVHLFGDNGLIVEITEAEYNRENGFWIKPLLEQLGQFVQPAPVSIHVNWVFPSTVKRVVDGNLKIVPIDWVMGDINFGPGLQTEQVSLWLAPGLKGAEQLIRLSIGDSAIFMRLNGVVQGPTGL